MIHRRYPHHGALAARAWQLRKNLSFYDALHLSIAAEPVSLEVAPRNNLSFYDAVYLALAESLNCPLITADVRIAARPSGPRSDPGHLSLLGDG